MFNNKQKNTGKNFLIIVITLFVFVTLLESGARLVLYFTRGSSTTGMPQRTRYLQYQPFVMFGPNWDEVLRPHNRETTKTDDGLYRILLLGGSTTSYFPTGQLEKSFSRKFPNRKFKVINMAAGGYSARQELIIAAIWAPSLKPDIIITLDGANDLNHRLRMKNAETFYLNSTYNFLVRRPLLAPLAHFIVKSQLIQGTFRWLERINIRPAHDYIDAVSVYISAQHSINVLARGIQATRIMALQPFIAFKEPLSWGEANFKHYKYREPVIKELYALLHKELTNLAASDGVIYVDGRFIFNGLSHTVFSDDVHFVSDEGYSILAESIANSVTERDLKR